jgi:N-acetyl-alpha-D-muramate 1-phosphate uridylyltransferase
MQAVLLAGGLATRMRPFTDKIPKSMLDVAGRPFVDWQLDKLASCGFDDVVMCIGHLGEQLRAHVEDGTRYGLRVRYSDEGEHQLGTAGAVRLALDLLDSIFLVTYGDSYLPFDYAGPLASLAAHSDCDGVMSVFKNDGKWDASNVIADDAWVLSYEKGTTDPRFDHIDYGAIALRREVIVQLPAKTFAGLEAIQHALAEKKRLRAFAAHDRFFEIGSPEGLATLANHLRKPS